MRTKLLLALAASGWIIVCYLLFEKLVFGGRMWERLRDTCRLRNRSLWRRLRRFSCRIFDTVLPEETEAQEPQEPIVSSDPVVRVVYVNGPERPRTDTGKTENQTTNKAITLLQRNENPIPARTGCKRIGVFREILCRRTKRRPIIRKRTFGAISVRTGHTI